MTTADQHLAGVVPLCYAEDVIRGAIAYAATGDRAGVQRMVEHARVFLANAITEVSR